MIKWYSRMTRNPDRAKRTVAVIQMVTLFVIGMTMGALSV